ncbi:MAG: hypothetical protein R6W83_10195 [Cryobacterium sp.]
MMKQLDEDSAPPTRRRILNRRVLGFAALTAVALTATTYLAAPAFSEANREAARPQTPGESVTAVETRPPAPVAPTAPAAPAPAPEPPAPDAPGLSNKPDTPTPLPPEQAKAAVKKFLDSSVAVDPAAPAPDAVLGDAASGSILAEIENDTQELEANGWTRKGTATIEAMTIVSSDSSTDPATVVAQVCVDSSKVLTLDHSGEPVGSSGSTVQRALNIYTLHYIAGVWKVVARTFPDNPDC